MRVVYTEFDATEPFDRLHARAVRVRTVLGCAARLRLDTREGAIEDLGGYAAIVPGTPNQSELITRIPTDDPDLLMPPADSHKKRLDKDSIETLQQWIRQGAVWGRHWAFEPPVAAPVPDSASG